MTRKPFRGPGEQTDRLVPEQRRSRRREPETRRERLREQTREQIKAAARELLAPHHSGELSLRAVARAVGMSPSGIYRYFESREALVAALASDACESAQAALTAAMDGVEAGGPSDHLEQAVALAWAYRRWCLGHSAEFALLFGTDRGPGILETGAAEGAAEGAVQPFFRAPLEHYGRGVRIGAVDPPDTALPGDPGLSPAAEAVRAATTPDLSAREVGVLLWGWASLHGFIGLELFGPLASFYADPDAAYDRHARAVFAAMGFRPAADEASS